MSTENNSNTNNTREIVKDALKQSLEGELAIKAFVHSGQGELTGFSRSTGSYHSRSGHDFSRAQEFNDDGFSQTSSVANLAFAKEFLNLQK